MFFNCIFLQFLYWFFWGKLIFILFLPFIYSILFGYFVVFCLLDWIIFKGNFFFVLVFLSLISSIPLYVFTWFSFTLLIAVQMYQSILHIASVMQHHLIFMYLDKSVMNSWIHEFMNSWKHESCSHKYLVVKFISLSRFLKVWRHI